MDVSDSVLDHLRHVAALPDLSGRATSWNPRSAAAGWAWSTRRATASLIGARGAQSPRRGPGRRGSVASRIRSITSSRDRARVWHPEIFGMKAI